MSALADDAVRYRLTVEQLEFAAAIRDLVAARVRPRAAAIDAAGEFPADIRERFAEHDLFALPFEARHGALGTGTLMTVVAIEEVAKACASSALMLAVQDLATPTDPPRRLVGASGPRTTAVRVGRVARRIRIE